MHYGVSQVWYGHTINFHVHTMMKVTGNGYITRYTIWSYEGKVAIQSMADLRGPSLTEIALPQFSQKVIG